MSDGSDYVLRRIRDYVRDRKAVVAATFPKGLKETSYHQACGAHRELDLIEKALQEAIRKVNSPEGQEADEAEATSPVRKRRSPAA